MQCLWLPPSASTKNEDTLQMGASGHWAEVWTMPLQNLEIWDYALSRKTKHSKTRQACTECDYSHPLGSKVKAYYRQVHFGIKRVQRNMSCRQGDCQNFGSSGCPESDHFLLYCDYCESTTATIGNMKRHIQERHFSTKLESSSTGLAYSCESCNYKASYGNSQIKSKDAIGNDL